MKISQEEAAVFMQVLGACQAFVPPMIFNALPQSNLGRAIAAAAQGAATIEVAMPAAPPGLPAKP